jgi:tetratricopeptide (TPR) repeat protein
MNPQRVVGMSVAGPEAQGVGVDGALAMIASLNNLGSVLGALGDLSGAREHLERAVRVAEVAFGPDHMNVGTCLNNLGCVLQDQGDLSGAQASYERALAIAEASYVPDPGLASRLGNLGCLLWEQGDLSGARRHLERALAVAESALASTPGEVETIRDNLDKVRAAAPEVRTRQMG